MRLWKKILIGVAVLLFLGVIFVLLHVTRPEMDVAMVSVQPLAIAYRLQLRFLLVNNSYLDLMDPVIACDLKGSTGATIATISKTLSEVLAARSKQSFTSVDMGKIPEQTVTFDCYLKKLSIKWR